MTAGSGPVRPPGGPAPPACGASAARAGAAAALSACLLAACAGRGGAATSPTGPPASNSFEWAGLRLEVRLLRSTPDRIRARGTLENVEDHPVTREVPFCVVMLRVYRSEGRIWSDGARSGCFGRRSVRLRPGESRSYARTVRARRVLGDSLPAGRYRVRAFWPRTSRPGATRTEIEVPLGEVRLDPGGAG